MVERVTNTARSENLLETRMTTVSLLLLDQHSHNIFSFIPGMEAQI